MKGLIQRFPSALLPLLSIKASETPPGLEETVSPSIEMTPFYLSDRMEVAIASVLGISAQQTLLLPVPRDEYWWVWSVTATAQNVGVGASVQLASGISDPSGTLSFLSAMAAPVVSVAGQLLVSAGVAPVPILLRPGTNCFAMTLVDPGAPTLDLICRALIARLSTNS